MNDFLLLALNLNERKLTEDLQICLGYNWHKHFNTNDYSGSWTVIALRSQSGDSNDILANDTGHSFKDTALLEQCHYFKEILEQMLFEKETIRLLRLQPNSIIKKHRDIGLAYRFDCFRLHIPIVTDTSVEFMIGENNVAMKKGECWYADFDLPHSVKNNSKYERIHLVIDGKRNAWTDELFAKAGYDFEAEKKHSDYSIETKKQMINQLRLIKTITADEMIKKLETEIMETTRIQKNEN